MLKDEDLNSHSQNPCKMPGMVVDVYIPSTGKVETGGFLGTLASQLVSSRLSERFCFKIQSGRVVGGGACL